MEHKETDQLTNLCFYGDWVNCPFSASVALMYYEHKRRIFAYLKPWYILNKSIYFYFLRFLLVPCFLGSPLFFREASSFSFPLPCPKSWQWFAASCRMLSVSESHEMAVQNIGTLLSFALGLECIPFFLILCAFLSGANSFSSLSRCDKTLPVSGLQFKIKDVILLFAVFTIEGRWAPREIFSP